MEWAVGAYGTYTLGGAWVPMYEQQQSKEWQYILADSGAKVVIVANDGIRAQLDDHAHELPDLEQTIVIDLNPIRALVSLRAVRDRPRFVSVGIQLLDERVDAGRIRVQHGPRVGVDRLIIGFRRGSNLKLPHRDILCHPRLTDKFRPASVSPVAIGIHMPETVLSRGQPLTEKGLARRARPDVRDAAAISVDVNRAI